MSAQLQSNFVKQVQPLVLDIHSSKILNQIYFKGLAEKFNLKSTEFTVLAGLACHYNPKQKDFFPSQAFLSKKLNISERSVGRAIKRLAELGLIMYETKNNNRYVFTNIFFAALEMSDPIRQNVGQRYDKMSDKHIKKHVNNSDSNSFKNKNTYYNNNQQRSTCPSIEETKQMLNEREKIERGSPLDWPKDRQISWYNDLPLNLKKTSIFAKQIREKYNLDDANNLETNKNLDNSAQINQKNSHKNQNNKFKNKNKLC